MLTFILHLLPWMRSKLKSKWILFTRKKKKKVQNVPLKQFSELLPNVSCYENRFMQKTNSQFQRHPQIPQPSIALLNSPEKGSAPGQRSGDTATALAREIDRRFRTHSSFLKKSGMTFPLYCLPLLQYFSPLDGAIRVFLLWV